MHAALLLCFLRRYSGNYLVPKTVESSFVTLYVLQERVYVRISVRKYEEHLYVRISVSKYEENLYVRISVSKYEEHLYVRTSVSKYVCAHQCEQI